MRHMGLENIKVCWQMRGADSGGKLASTQFITRVHTYAVAELRWSGSKISSATNGYSTQFSASASKPRAPNHFCPEEMVPRLPLPFPCVCSTYVWTYRGSRAGMSKSARLRSATAPCISERSFRHAPCFLPTLHTTVFTHTTVGLVHLCWKLKLVEHRHACTKEVKFYWAL